jgi:hypothetical protein
MRQCPEAIPVPPEAIPVRQVRAIPIRPAKPVNRRRRIYAVMAIAAGTVAVICLLASEMSSPLVKRYPYPECELAMAHLRSVCGSNVEVLDWGKRRYENPRGFTLISTIRWTDRTHVTHSGKYLFDFLDGRLRYAAQEE